MASADYIQEGEFGGYRTVMVIQAAITTQNRTK
jgi:hypothetical protein